jgi:probable O-glycosylation ligase (exosortase A-associated)
LKWHRFHLGVLLLFLAVVNSAVFAFRSELAWPRVYDYALTLLQYVFLCAFIRDLRDVRKVFWAIGLSISFVALRYNYGKFGLGEYGWEGPTGDRNELAMMMVMAMPILLVLGVTAEQRISKWIALAAVAPCALVVIFSLSRGGVLGLAAVALYILARLHHKKWIIGLGVVAVLAGMSLVPPEFYERMGTVQTAADSDASSRGRINAWHASMAMVRDRPMTGVGVGNFLVRFRHYAPNPEDAHVAHSSFFQILGDTGLPGTAAWLFLLITLWLSAGSVENEIRRAEHGRWTDARYYVFAVRAAWIGYVICGLFLSQEDFDLFYQLLAITARLAVVAHVGAAAGDLTLAAPAHARPMRAASAVGAGIGR